MGAGRTVIIAGSCLFGLGLFMFYMTGALLEGGAASQVRNAGTFVGLGGMGAALGGILLCLIERSGGPVAGPGRA